MGRSGRVALLCALVGVLLVTADAVRSHDSFAATTYYDKDDARTEVPFHSSDPSQLPASQVDTSVNGDGASSAKYTVENNNSGVDSPAERYPHGYYPDSRFTQSYHDLPESQHTSYSAVDSSRTVTNNGVSDRYPQGYYPKSHTNGGNPSYYQQSSGAHFSTSSLDHQENTALIPGERYPHGYYPNSQYTGPNKQYSGVSYYSPNADQTTHNAGERYPHGYYPNNNYAGNSQTSTTQFNGAHNNRASYYTGQFNGLPNNAGSYSYSSNPVGERYPHGYYPHSQNSNSHYTNQGPKPVNTGVSYSTAQGNFNTLPYPNNAGDLPYEQGGSGCRTAYWADHIEKWPRFFNIKSTVGDAFGSQAKEVYGETTIMEALLKYGTDPFSELLRSGCTAILNAYSRGQYSITHTKVIEGFNTALVSKEAASAQALVFETANVESISAGNACN